MLILFIGLGAFLVRIYYVCLASLPAMSFVLRCDFRVHHQPKSPRNNSSLYFPPQRRRCWLTAGLILFVYKISSRWIYSLPSHLVQGITNSSGRFSLSYYSSHARAPMWLNKEFFRSQERLLYIAMTSLDIMPDKRIPHNCPGGSNIDYQGKK